MAQEMGHLKKVGTISVDGTKIHANASKHSAVSYGRADEMKRKLKTKKGAEIYKKRKETVEPVFGIIKQAMWFRQFLLRGLERAGIEWDLVTTSYNFKKLFSLSGRGSLPLRELWGN